MEILCTAQQTSVLLRTTLWHHKSRK